jgi:hypothetical protein
MPELCLPEQSLHVRGVGGFRPFMRSGCSGGHAMHHTRLGSDDSQTRRDQRATVCLTCSHQRREVVQTMSECCTGTLEVVGR